MKVFSWLRAYVVVYSDMLRTMTKTRLLYIAALIGVAFLALILGPIGTVLLLIVCLFVLPVINTDVKSAIDREYSKRK